MPQEKVQAWIQAWIQRVYEYVQEVIKYDGDNLYKEGKKMG